MHASFKTGFIRKSLLIWEISVVNPEGTKFGAFLHTNQEPSPDVILHHFNNNFKMFFIDIESKPAKRVKKTQKLLDIPKSSK